jgi:hypothetical protein
MTRGNGTNEITANNESVHTKPQIFALEMRVDDVDILEQGLAIVVTRFYDDEYFDEDVKSIRRNGRRDAPPVATEGA